LITLFRPAAALALALTLAAGARADESFAKVTEAVNKRLVKIFGAGGFLGVPAYGSGVLVSPKGHILTVASQMLETQDLRIHLANGDRYHAVIVATEPDLDLALLQIREKNEPIDTPDYFDVAEEAGKAPADPGTGVLAFSNEFNIATRGEPMSVEHGVIAAISRLRGRRGVHEAPYDGDVYFVDAITNNPGAGGGALTTRDGKQLLGLIGKELKNTLSETWINYAVPVQAKIKVKLEKETQAVSVVDFVQKGIKGEYRARPRPKKTKESGRIYTGIILVPNVVDRTPPYVEDLVPDSPGARAGLRPDDLIVYIDGEQVVSIKEYKEAMDRYDPGTEVKVEVRRGDRLTTLTMKVEETPKKRP
jgi:serine protease Do